MKFNKKAKFKGRFESHWYNNGSVNNYSKYIFSNHQIYALLRIINSIMYYLIRIMSQETDQTISHTFISSSSATTT